MQIRSYRWGAMYAFIFTSLEILGFTSMAVRDSRLIRYISSILCAGAVVLLCRSIFCTKTRLQQISEDKIDKELGSFIRYDMIRYDTIRYYIILYYTILYYIIS